MKYLTKIYAQALIEGIALKSPSERKEIVKRFYILLAKTNQLKRIPAILKEAEKLYYKKQGFSKIVVETADTLSESFKKELQAIVSTPLALMEQVEPSLGAGLKVLIDDEVLIDASALTAIKRLFRNYVYSTY